MKAYKHSSYEAYIEAQEKCTLNGENNIWVPDVEIEILSHHIQSHIPDPTLGLCHGVRNGYEVKKLRECLHAEERGLEIIGTELSSCAERYEHVIQWDFHNSKPEWLRQTSFIYSNSFDHAHDPRRALTEWLKCLIPNKGLLYIELFEESEEEEPTPADCLVFNIQELKEIILSIENTFIKEVISIPPAGGQNNTNTVHNLNVVVAGTTGAVK
tara:strand:- start:9532 stop:10170 length:639 start_codon:yes stop_codon:yes gene_type:complete